VRLTLSFDNGPFPDVTPGVLDVLASFAVPDAKAEFKRLKKLGVRFTQEPVEMGPVTTAVFDDTCGNLIQIASPN